LNIVYQDSAILVVDKPSGLATQARADRAGSDLYSELKKQFSYVGLHHRLDQPTSGLVLFTIDKRANKGVSELFKQRRIEKTYAAILWGMCIDDGEWTAPVKDKEARTTMHVVGSRGGRTAARLVPHTGRLHQIRWHAAMAGMPVLGDRRYGEQAALEWPRLALHAEQLAFAHPLTGARLHIQAPIPDDLRTLWESAGGN